MSANAKIRAKATIGVASVVLDQRMTSVGRVSTLFIVVDVLVTVALTGRSSQLKDLRREQRLRDTHVTFNVFVVLIVVLIRL